MDNRIRIFDTTLRDGEQSPGCSMNLKEKIQVAKCLESLKVDIIEAGFAISSPGDFESVQTIAAAVKECTVASLARASVKDIDTAWEAVKHAADPRIHLFLATSPLHMQYKLKKTPEEILEMTAAMTAHAAKYTSNVEFSAEDATRSDWDFLVRIVDAAIRAGATTVNIPDTVGYTTPSEMQALIEYLRKQVPDSDKAVFSVHCHNDLGLATANSLAGVAGGARQIECTINGLGERSGNSALEEVTGSTRRRLPAPAVPFIPSSARPLRSTSPSSGAMPLPTKAASTSTGFSPTSRPTRSSHRSLSVSTPTIWFWASTPASMPSPTGWRPSVTA